MKTETGRHGPVGILVEVGNVDTGRVDTEDVVVCTGAVRAVVIVNEPCDELLAEAK